MYIMPTCIMTQWLASDAVETAFAIALHAWTNKRAVFRLLASVRPTRSKELKRATTLTVFSNQFTRSTW